MKFDAWFDGSVVTTKNGAPKIVYHSTYTNWRILNLKKVGLGMHFGTYAAATDRNKDESYIKMAYLRIINPYVTRDAGTWDEFFLEQLRKDRRFDREKIDKLLWEEQNNLGLSWDDSKKKWDLAEFRFYNKVRKLIGDAGFDGLLYRNRFEHKGSISYCVWNADQICFI